MAGKEYTTAPILVNADGHPIPQYLDITDTTDSPQGTFKPLTQLQADHPDVQNVQLTGSLIKEETILDRSIRVGPATSFRDLVPPDGASYLAVQLNVYGVTGTFAEGKAIRMAFRYKTLSQRAAVIEARTTRSSEARGNY